MNCEYLFLTDNKSDFPLDEGIRILDTLDNNDYIVANSDIDNTQIYAPEINFYAQNTLDDIGQKIQNIKTLYDVRSLVFDLAQDMDYEKEVNDKLLIVTPDEKKEKYEKILNSDKFTSITLNPKMILDVNGHIGELVVSIQKDGEQYEINCDQIVTKLYGKMHQSLR